MQNKKNSIVRRVFLLIFFFYGFLEIFDIISSLCSNGRYDDTCKTHILYINAGE